MIWFGGISLLILLLYIQLIYSFFRSWKNKPSEEKSSHPSLNISVIVPFFNEEKNISALIDDLCKQEYPADALEIILVDDFSEDSTFDRAQQKADGLPNLHIVENVYSKGKKFALRTGVEKAKAEIILVSDADCRFHPQWVRFFADFFYRNPSTVLLSSGVKMLDEGRVSGLFQAVEFSSLVASGAASFLQGSPIMCNGANLAFRKELFLEAFEHLHPSINTGDDMFLMLFAKRKYRENMAFLKSQSAFTLTKALPGWKSFIRQRLRWTSKASLYRDPKLIYTSTIVLITNLIILSFLILSFIHIHYVVFFAFFLILKSLPDYFFLKAYLTYTQQERLLKFFLPSQLIYIFIIPLTGTLGILGPLFRKISK
jgi:cellulose synthase/poly-beta-1,6-N-acetylglucosamine synthase-like glycosyltransferase